MNSTAPHADAVVFDGLIVSNGSREVFADIGRGGSKTATCTSRRLGGFPGHQWL